MSTIPPKDHKQEPHYVETPRTGPLPVCARVFEIEKAMGTTNTVAKPQALDLTDLMKPPTLTQSTKHKEQVVDETMQILFGPTPRELKGKSFLKA